MENTKTITGNYSFENGRYSGFKLERILMIFGIPVVGFLLTFILNNGQFDLFSSEYCINCIATIVVTGINWLGCRYIVIKLWNKYPWHIHPVKHILVEIPVVLLFTIGLNLLVSWAFVLLEKEVLDMGLLFRNTAIIVLLVSFLVSLHEALFFYFQWKENFNKSLVLEKARIKAEYDALKNQINPHFLFNNLNTLITLVDKNKQATNYIQVLSDFLRYTLDLKESDIKTVGSELDIVKKYVYLQKLRFGDKLIFTTEVDEKYYDHKLPSMALQMIVDNAIKHNTISNDKALSIMIFIDSSYIVVKNNLQKRYGVISTNQGLENLKRRYSFITGKEVKIIETDKNFTVKLPLI